MENQIYVRDLRSKEKFVVDDEYLNGYARICGIHATGVYMSLCRHADKDQKSFPSNRQMAEQLGVSTKSVMRGIKNLEAANIILKKRVGKMCNNRYYLLDKSEWLSKEKAKRVIEGEVTNSPITKNKKKKKSEVTNGDFTSPPQGVQRSLSGTSNSKETHSKETHSKVLPAEAGELKPQDEVNAVFEIFYQTINPNINYGNRTTRTAAEWLVKKYGFEKTLDIARFACSVQGQPYAPTITTPYQLKEKMAQLVVFAKRQDNKAPGVLKI
jgi:DNA-binding transcriptional regulator YhcF (GntR family)